MKKTTFCFAIGLLFCVSAFAYSETGGKEIGEKSDEKISHKAPFESHVVYSAKKTPAILALSTCATKTLPCASSLAVPKKFSRLSFSAQIDMPEDHNNLPEFELNLRRDESRNKKHAAINFKDEACTGEYTVNLKTISKKGSYEYHEFESKVQWPDEFDVVVSFIKKEKKRYYYNLIIDDEQFEFKTDERLGYFGLKVYNGNINVRDINLTKR